MIAAIAIDPEWYRRSMRGVYVRDCSACMALVLLAGTRLADSRRWIDVSFFRFQPSEFGKMLLVLFVAAFLADRLSRIERPAHAADGRRARRAADRCSSSRSPTSGAALVYVAAVGGLPVRGRDPLVASRPARGASGCSLAVAVLWLLPAAGMPVLKTTSAHRLTGFLEPGQGSGRRHVQHAPVDHAVGAGRRDGPRRRASATQTSLDYLPEHATDFAFASLAEQRGFLGAPCSCSSTCSSSGEA